MNIEKKTMRDVFIEQVYNRMFEDKTLFFLAADFGSPKLDKLREDFGDRFINVGIAEQNLVNVSTGLALEGFTVYAYAIAPFLIMRAYEQIRNNLSLLSHTNKVNVNLVGVGAGLSYDVSGPTHHSVEDISIIRTLPNLCIFSPSDWVLAEKFVDYSIEYRSPKFIRFDGKPLPGIYENVKGLDIKTGFFELAEGKDICLASTGYMTHTALKAVERLKKEGIFIGLVDVFLIKPLDGNLLFEALCKYKHVITLEEAFINKGGLDSLIAWVLSDNGQDIKLKRMGFGDEYHFEMGGREALHRLAGLDEDSVIKCVKDLMEKI